MQFLKPVLLVFAAETLCCAAQINVQQLLELLRSAKSANRSDSDIVRKLSSVELSERLSDTRLREILTQTNGPRTAAALQLIADASMFEPTPHNEQSGPPAPTPERQSGISRLLASA